MPDELWEKVGVKKAKGKTGGKRKERAKVLLCGCLFGLGPHCVSLVLILGVTSTNFKSSDIECY
jgi:hypothetical protein